MINIQNLKFAYRNSGLLFDKLDLSLEQGNVYGLLGKNGAGKTTLLKIILGLLFPSEGSCKINTHSSVERLPEILSDIYIIPEEYSLPAVTIATYVKANSVFYKNFSIQEFDKLLAEFELKKSRRLNALSYGQKKKFLVAFGIATNAKLIIFDEPTNGLDIPSKGQFRKIIASSINEERIFLISTHQVRDLESIIDTIIIIDDGKIIFNHTTEKISNKFNFKMIRDELSNEDILYSEDVLGGKMAILKNQTNQIETKIEMELLFNGILQNPELFNQTLNL